MVLVGINIIIAYIVAQSSSFMPNTLTRLLLKVLLFCLIFTVLLLSHPGNSGTFEQRDIRSMGRQSVMLPPQMSLLWLRTEDSSQYSQRTAHVLL